MAGRGEGRWRLHGAATVDVTATLIGGCVEVLAGRTAAPASTGAGGMTQDEAVLDALGDLGVPIVADLEIGHVPPHLPMLNGARARVLVDGERHEIDQRCTPGLG